MEIIIEQQTATFTRGAETLVALVARLEAGNHLLQCWTTFDGVELPARLMVKVAGPMPDDLVTMESPEQRDTFAMILGTALTDARATACEIVANSTTAPGSVPVERAWVVEPGWADGEPVPEGSWIRPLSDAEACASYDPRDAEGRAFATAFWLGDEPCESDDERLIGPFER